MESTVHDQVPLKSFVQGGYDHVNPVWLQRDSPDIRIGEPESEYDVAGLKYHKQG
jgi:hypothetical protein